VESECSDSVSTLDVIKRTNTYSSYERSSTTTTNNATVQSNVTTNTVTGAFSPLATKYGTTLYRSRQEARWSVFFDCIGLTTFYEFQGFNLGGIFYLPDIYVPTWDAWIEVKPDTPTAMEREKADRLATFTKKPVFVLSQPIEVPTLDCEEGTVHQPSVLRVGLSEIDAPAHVVCFLGKLQEHDLYLQTKENGLVLAGDTRNAPQELLTQVDALCSDVYAVLRPLDNAKYAVHGGWDIQQWWTECPVCHDVRLTSEGRCDLLPCKHVSHKHINYASDRLTRAYYLAASHRFETPERVHKIAA